MTVQNPAIFLQAGSHPAEDVRRYISAVSNDTEGIVGVDDMEVTEKSGTPDMSVDVAGGRAFISGDEATYQGAYFVENRGTTNLTVTAADATNPRIDIVVARVRDSAYSGATDAWALEVIAGTPAASPTAPTVPDNAIKLADVAVAALASSIVNANITDARVLHNPHFALVSYTASGTFDKADYPWAKSIKVELVGGGGGSGGTNTTSGAQRCESGGGGGGGYSMKRILVDDLAASETVTVGAGGAAGNSSPTGGSTGGTSSFGSHCSATGGQGSAAATSGGSGSLGLGSRGYRGAGTGGDVNLPGGSGFNGVVWDQQPSMQNAGGASFFSGNTTSAAGYAVSAIAGEGPGAGASGHRVTLSQSSAAGAAGADGIVIVEVYG